MYGGANDPRMGTLDFNTRCRTCDCTYTGIGGNQVNDCPGHFGHMEVGRDWRRVSWVARGLAICVEVWRFVSLAACREPDHCEGAAVLDLWNSGRDTRPRPVGVYLQPSVSSRKGPCAPGRNLRSHNDGDKADALSEPELSKHAKNMSRMSTIVLHQSLL